MNPAAEVGRIARDAGASVPARRYPSRSGSCPVDVDAGRLRHAHRHRTQVPPRPARHRIPVGPGRASLDRLDPFVAEIRSAVWDGGPVVHVGGGRTTVSRPGRTAYVNVLGLGSGGSAGPGPWTRTRSRARTRALGAQLRDRLAEINGSRRSTTSGATAARSSPSAWPDIAPPRSLTRSASSASTSAPPCPNTTS